ncbi:dynein heavy chain and region D6 of dynein motor-domain-containing protein [Lentinula lateritia]|nr:dynein heavy chain and region D6 of dynein motor-domain-containing protein [Lentinula lateritia]
MRVFMWAGLLTSGVVALSYMQCLLATFLSIMIKRIRRVITSIFYTNTSSISPLSFPNYISESTWNLLFKVHVSDPSRRVNLENVMQLHWLAAYHAPAINISGQVTTFGCTVEELQRSAMDQPHQKGLAYQKQMKGAAVAATQATVAQRASVVQRGRKSSYGVDVANPFVAPAGTVVPLSVLIESLAEKKKTKHIVQLEYNIFCSSWRKKERVYQGRALRTIKPGGSLADPDSPIPSSNPSNASGSLLSPSTGSDKDVLLTNQSAKNSCQNTPTVMVEPFKGMLKNRNNAQMTSSPMSSTLEADDKHGWDTFLQPRSAIATETSNYPSPNGQDQGINKSKAQDSVIVGDPMRSTNALFEDQEKLAAARATTPTQNKYYNKNIITGDNMNQMNTSPAIQTWLARMLFLQTNTPNSSIVVSEGSEGSVQPNPTTSSNSTLTIVGATAKPPIEQIVPNFNFIRSMAQKAQALVPTLIIVKDSYTELGMLTSFLATVEALRAMLIIKCLCPDCLLQSTAQFVHNVFNTNVSAQSVYKLGTMVLDEVSAVMLLALVSVTGYKTSHQVNNLVKNTAACSSSMAMGSLGFSLADQAITSAAWQGTWVLLKNEHLTPEWLGQLEKKLQTLNPHQNL